MIYFFYQICYTYIEKWLDILSKKYQKNLSSNQSLNLSIFVNIRPNL